MAVVEAPAVNGHDQVDLEALIGALDSAAERRLQRSPAKYLDWVGREGRRRLQRRHGSA